jgi:hypothetical protein
MSFPFLTGLLRYRPVVQSRTGVSPVGFGKTHLFSSPRAP